MATLLCPAAVDDTFGPWATSACRGGFDFTLRFEESILVLPLLSLVIVAIPFRLLQLARAQPKTRGSVLPWLKLSAAACHAALQLALLIIWCRNSSGIRRTATTVPALSLAFIAALGLLPLSIYEHYRSIRPSFVLEVYLLLSILFETVRARTIWMLHENGAAEAVFTSTVVLKGVMFVLESIEKRSLLLPGHQHGSIEATSGTLARAFMVWLHPLLWTGYKREIALADLVFTDDGLSIETLHDRFQSAWSALPKAKRNVNGALLSTWFAVLNPALLAPAFPRLWLTGFTFAQPFLVERAIILAVGPGGQPYNNYSYGLIVAFIFVYFGLAFSTVKYEYRAYRAAVVSRASLVPCLFDKTLRLSIADADSKAALTLFSTDMETVTRGVTQMHEAWASLLEIGIAMWLLERQLGVSTVIPICVVLATMIFGGAAAIPTGMTQAAWIQASQKRVSSTSYIISKMKWIRLSGLSSFATQSIEGLRTKEMQVSEKYRYLLTWVILSSSVAPLLIPLLTYVTYACLARRNGDVLGLAKAFTSFSLFILLMKPLGLIVVSLPAFASAAASIGRVQEYLNRQEKDATSSDETKEPSMTISDEKRTQEEQQVLDLDEKRQDFHRITSPTIISARGVVKWPGAEKAVLDLTRIDIQRDTFTIILGPVACGKSTLLHLFLNEMTQFGGELEVHSSGSAYCAQEPFIPSRSCQDVITGNVPYDAAWYNEVVKACALDVDFQEWPRGGDTIVGSAATSLSGGQKQRLALARAVYSRKELVILDDSFTGLDPATEEQVFQNLLGAGGLLREPGRTVILATSTPRRAPHADLVLLLGPDGTILDDGPFTELRARSTALSSLALLDDDEIVRMARLRDQTGAKAAVVGDAKVAAVLSQTKKDEIVLNHTARDASVYTYYLGSAGRANLAIFVVCLVGLAFFDTFPSVWLKWWSESNVKEPNARLDKWLGGYAGFTIGGIIATLFGSRQLFVKIISHTGLVLHGRLVQAVSRAPTSFFTTVDTGVTVNRFSQDLQLIDMQLPLTAFGTVVGLAYAVGQTIVMAVASKYVIPVLVGLIVLFYFIQHFYLRTSRQVRYLDIELKAPLYSQLIETSDGLASIRAFGYEAEARAEHVRILEHSQRAVYTLYCLQRWLILTVDLVIAILAVVLAAIAVSLRQRDGAGNIGLALVNLLGLSASVRTVLLTWVGMEIAIGAVARVKNFVDNIQSETDSSASLEDAPKDWPSRGDIEINDTSASYASESQFLRGLSLSIRHGEKIALCGRTGSGKSSLLLALARMLDLDAGGIIIDGLDTSTLKPDSVRTALVAVPQETFILDGTVRQNLDPLSERTDEEIEHALRKCHLYDLVEALNGEGLEAAITDASFSHGQRKLFGVCRALLRKSKVVIMDEPTSGLDGDMSLIVEEVIHSWSDATVVVALHKVDAIMRYDRVAILDQGRLVAFDEPQVLRQREDPLVKGLFRELKENKGGRS